MDLVCRLHGGTCGSERHVCLEETENNLFVSCAQWKKNSSEACFFFSPLKFVTVKYDSSGD